MKNMKKIVLLAVCVLMIAAFSACSMVTVNEEKDMAQVVATVNGTDLYKQEYVPLLSNLMFNYGIVLEDLYSQSDPEAILDDALEEFIDQELIYQAAVEEGLADNSEENYAAVKAEIEATIESIREMYYSSVEEGGISEEQAEEEFQEYLKSAAYDDIDYAINQTIRTNAINAMYDQVMASVDYTEEEAREYYDMQVEIHQQTMESNPDSFELYQAFGESYYNPEGSKYVKNLLITIPDEAQNEIAALRASGDDTAADILRDEELAKIKESADDALMRANEGEDFDLLIEELGQDPGMQAEPAKTYGYLVYEGSEYVPEFEAASLALENEGDISELVATDFGYHIIKYEADAAGAVPFEMVMDSIISSNLTLEQNSAYTTFTEGLREGADIKKYNNRLTINME